MHQMTEAEFEALATAAYMILPKKMDTPASRALLWAIWRQESRMIHRRQINGPARGLGQFEKGGGVRGVLRHEASAEMARDACVRLGVVPTEDGVYRMLEHSDILAFIFSRLLLWTDPRALPRPVIAAEEEAWAYYLRNWRPGKPHRSTWGNFWREGTEIIR
jgi:hypothetical protein